MKKIDIVLLIVMFMFLYGCKPKEKLIISFETNGGSSIEDVVIDSTLDFVLPDDPVKEGYTFAGWYSDIDLTIKYDLNTILTKDITLYADWGTIGLEYELINDGTEYSVNKGNASELTEIQIPNIKDGKKVTRITDFKKCLNLKEIIIPNSINKIDGWSFLENVALEKIILPDGISSIDAYTFSKCTSLKSIMIPDSVVFISKEAFNECDSIEYEIYEGLKYLNNWIMGVEDTSVSEVSLKETTVGIGPNAFWDCVNLTNITFPDTLKAISERAFTNCYSLTKITLPDNFERIGDFAFEGCITIKSIFISKKTKELSGIPWDLEEINVDPQNEFYTSIDGVLYNKEITELIRFPNYKEVIEFTVPETVIDIGPSAFSDNKFVKKVTLQNGVETIDDGAFFRCGALEEIILSDTLKKINDYAFAYYEKLKEIIIPRSVEYIGANLFIGYVSGLKIYCEIEAQPEGWDEFWNPNDELVVWGYTRE